MTAAPQSNRLRAEHRKPVDPLQWYQEMSWVTDALLKAQPMYGTIYDPCCGGGNIVEACRNFGKVAYGSDIVDRANGAYPVHDFLTASFTETPFYKRYGLPHNIVMNPPYRDVSLPFILQAMSISQGLVISLHPLAFLEGIKRGEMYRAGELPLRKVWVHSRRVSCPPGGRGISAKGGAVAYAWFVWDQQYCGEPTLGWLA